MTTSRRKGHSVLAAVALVLSLTGVAVAADLDGPASIVYDSFAVPTIIATTEHDAIYLQGYLHARDRFFQMDLQRHAFSGRLAELFGPSVIPQDVQLRTLGLRRAAVRSLPVQTPEVIGWLEAYADGVNAFILDESNPLPIEYGFLELDRDGIEPWTVLDSLTTAKGLAFQLSFDLGDIDRTLALLNFRGVCDILGCNGLQLYNDDLYRVAPFEATPSVSLARAADEVPGTRAEEEEELPSYMTNPAFESMVRDYREAIVDIPMLSRALEGDTTEQGSNWWIVSGALTDSGFPMIANDPHLALDTPATFYEVHLAVPGAMNVAGTSFPGAPGVVLGCNDTICWGATVNGQDVTDLYNEVLVPLNPAAPFQPTHTLFDGVPEPLEFIPQTFLVNAIGDGFNNTLVDAGVPADQGGVTLIVPRRDNGPIVQVSVDLSSPTPITGVSVQYVGWSATQELECFRRFARAGSMQDFKDALQYFDFGSQNWSYADINGNIAYYTSGEVPIREDLQFGFFPDGLQHPGFIRDGAHDLSHEWLPVLNPQPQQATPHEILPFAEMPQLENPASGYILNANNDPIGTTFDNVSWNQFRAGFNGLLYLSAGYATGYRMGRMQRLFDDALASGPISFATLRDHQANNQLLDAEVLAPYLLDAYANATAPGAAPELMAIVDDPRVGDAIGRIAAWDFSTPTGINEGWDPSDAIGVPGPPPAGEIDASVAATIYSVWRGQVVRRVIDTTLATLPIPLTDYAPDSAQAMSALRRLLETYPITGGTGASLINFFNVPGVADQDVARDVILLGSLVNALDLLASDEFAPAFEHSTNLDDYRWGKLHRIVYDHPLGGPLSIPGEGSPLNLAPDLPGFSRSGGMGAVDASSHDARADGLNDFMFGSGPARRKIATMTPDGPNMLEVIPGGQSGIPGSPNQADQLALWLVNQYKPVWVDVDDAIANGVETEDLVCGDGVVTVGEECDDGNDNPRDGCAECMIVPLNPFFDIKLGDFPNDVNPYSNGVLPMVILGSDFFDVTQVDMDTVRFGPWGAQRVHDIQHLDDEDLDGYMDLTFHFWVRETGIQCFDTEATIWGAMLDGTPFVSTDSINTVGCREPEQPRPVQEPETVVTPPAGESDVFGDNK
jgi:penicillin amidase